ncbi:THxN family PEP-CTERM protein [Photobacterium galatheae]|nr:THxN family PEP-CTERM protein [Photobacterium galatheae]MCM0147094.1 THxN family PEP-CTERM protein [Photobacterium galatheae]
MKSFAKAVMSGLILLVSAHVSAAIVDVDFGDFTGSWVNAVAEPGQGQPVTSGNGTVNPTLRWGKPLYHHPGKQSGYQFESTAGFQTQFDTDTGTSDDFLLGEFTHLNNMILSSGARLKTVDLQLSTTVAIDGAAPIDVQFVFHFHHDETLNSAKHCANGEANGQGVNAHGCADIISVTTSDFSDVTEINGIQYTLNIQGFLVNGLFTDHFETMEKSTNSAIIRANISAMQIDTPVSEPSGLAIFGAFFIGGAVLRLKQKFQSR